MERQEILGVPTKKRKLPLESLFLAIVMAIGLAGIYGLFFQPKPPEKPAWYLQKTNTPAVSDVYYKK